MPWSAKSTRIADRRIARCGSSICLRFLVRAVADSAPVARSVACYLTVITETAEPLKVTSRVGVPDQQTSLGASSVGEYDAIIQRCELECREAMARNERQKALMAEFDARMQAWHLQYQIWVYTKLAPLIYRGMLDPTFCAPKRTDDAAAEQKP